MKKRLLSTMLALCLALTMLPLNALATDEPPVETETGAELQEEKPTTPENPTPVTSTEVTTDEQTTTPDSGGTSELGNPSEDATNSQLSGSDSGNEQGEPMILSGNEEPARASVTDSEIMASGTCGEGVHSDDVTWTLTIYGVLTISGTGNMSHYEIGDYLNGSPSTIHDPPWYPSRGRIKSVIIENGITSIGNDSFQDCENLTKVTIPDSVTTIGWSAFKNCKKLNNITLPNNLLNISQDTFSGCTSLSNIILPEKVQHIEAMAFYGCKNLTSVTIKNIYLYLIVGSAFYGCNKLTDIYYAGSEDDWKTWVELPGYDFLKNVKIHYGSAGTNSEGNKPVTPGGNNSSTSKEYKIYRNGGYEVFDISLEDCIKRTDIIDANGYNPQLAHMLISMCCSVYSETDMKRTFASFGFDGIADNSRDGIFLGYGLAKKQLSNGKTLVLVVTRGTPDFPDIEWGSNILPQFNITTGQHKGFSDAANGLYDRIGTQLGVTNFADVEFVITGFSRGAAAANILAGRLVDEHVPQSMIHAYTFACPDVGVMSENKAESYHCIFNIANANDIVSWVPKSIAPLANFGVAIINQILGLNWNKFGRSYWYSEDWDNYRNLQIGTSAHNQTEYMNFLRSEKSTREYKKRQDTKSALDDATNKRIQDNILAILTTFVDTITHIGCHCPVDVEILTIDGKVAGTVINNVPNIIMPEKVYIEVNGDQKDIFLLDNDQYTINLAGTDEGIMEYFVRNINLATWEILEEKTFANVAITNDKKMFSYINMRNTEVGADIPAIQLFVLGGNGKPEKEVLPDGNGTEVPIKNSSNGEGGKPSGGENNKPSSGNSSSPTITDTEGNISNFNSFNNAQAKAPSSANSNMQNNKSPDTGDDTPIMLLYLIGLASIFMLGCIVRKIYISH